MKKDAGFTKIRLKVDGGMTINNYIMQILANYINSSVERKKEKEITALGGAIAAGNIFIKSKLLRGMAEETKFWDSTDELKERISTEKTFDPEWTPEQIRAKYKRWDEALERSLNWIKI
jgi:glycerol kinase